MERTLHLLIMYTMMVLMLLLFHKGRRHPRSLMLGLYAMVEVITNGFLNLNAAVGFDFYLKHPFLHIIYKPFYCLWVPLFYLYFRYCLSTKFKFSKKHLYHFIPFVLFLLFFLFVILFKGSSYIRDDLYRFGSFLSFIPLAVDVTVKLQYLVYNILMIRMLILAERRMAFQPLVPSTTAVSIAWLRFIVYGYAIGCFIAVAAFSTSFFRLDYYAVINLVSVTYFFLFFFVMFYNTITHKLFDEDIKPKTSAAPQKELLDLMTRIDQIVFERQLFLDPELSLQQLAAAMNEKERTISHAINTVKMRNVNDYINAFRIEHACKLLLSNKEKPVFEVMYESGFNTKGAFNLAFKKVTGKTPTQFRLVLDA